VPTGRPDEWAHCRQRGQQPAQRLGERSWSEVEAAPARLAAWSIRRAPLLGIGTEPIGGSRRPDAQPRPTSASQYRQYSCIPHAPSGFPATLAMNPDLAGLLVIPKADSPSSGDGRLGWR